MSWSAIVLLVIGSFGCKWFGVAVLGRIGGADAMVGGRFGWFPAMTALIPPALFAALVAVQTLEFEGALQIDARSAGVAAGAIAVWRRAPFLLVVVVAMAVTAAIRWQT
ncbi:MAG: AzlD domain-containing protein [Acidimicrobiales bacterium]